MPRVHFVKKARKDNPAVKAGESYYWWKFRYGPKRYSATRPQRCQLTQSSFLSTLWELEDRILETTDDIETFRDELDTLCDECRDSLDAMPEALQYSSSSGELLQSRIDGLEEWMDHIDSLDLENIDVDDLTDEVHQGNPGIE